MTTTLEPDAPVPPPDAPSDERPAARASASPWRPLLLRMHFYAGILVGPFIAVAALTGLLFVFTPQLENVVHRHELRVDQAGRVAVPLDRQVGAAMAERPGEAVVEIQPAAAPSRTTRVVFADVTLGDKQRTVFVDPYTAEVRGTLVTWWGAPPVTTWLDRLHKDLHLGEPGRVYTELAASWLGVIALGGLFLWWQHLRLRRGSGLRRWLVPDLRSRGARRTTNWHATTGVWILVGLLALSVTGLTWSVYAGGRFESLVDGLSAHRPSVDSALAAPVVVDQPLNVGQVAEQAAAAGLREPWVITPPPDAGSEWVVQENDFSWRIHADAVALDPATGTVNEIVRYADWPVLAKLSSWGVKAHMGQAFGLLNQLLLAALAVGLLCVIVWGYRRWWQRRPTAASRWSVGRAPTGAGWRRIPLPQLAAAAVVVTALGWVMPVLGLSLLAFLVLDAVIGRIRRS